MLAKLGYTNKVNTEKTLDKELIHDMVLRSRNIMATKLSSNNDRRKLRTMSPAKLRKIGVKLLEAVENGKLYVDSTEAERKKVMKESFGFFILMFLGRKLVEWIWERYFEAWKLTETTGSASRVT